jgi:hypothetical protein
MDGEGSDADAGASSAHEGCHAHPPSSHLASRAVIALQCSGSEKGFDTALRRCLYIQDHALGLEMSHNRSMYLVRDQIRMR